MRALFDGWYGVSSDGRVWSFVRRKSRKGGKWQFQKSDTPVELRGNTYGGYSSVLMMGRTVRVHRLVAEAFHGPCPKGMECHHIDGNTRNNAAENLRWTTKSGNIRASVEAGTHPNNKGIRHGMSRLTENDVERMRSARESGRSFRQLSEEFGVCVAQCFRVVNRQQWQHV